MVNYEEKYEIIFLQALADDLFPIWRPVEWLFKKKKTLNQWLKNLNKNEPIIVYGDVDICSYRFVVSLKKLLKKNDIPQKNFTLMAPNNLKVHGNFIFNEEGDLYDNPGIILTTLTTVGDLYRNPPIIPKGLSVMGDFIVDAEIIPEDIEVKGTLRFAGWSEEVEEIVISEKANINGINFGIDCQYRRRQNLVFPNKNFNHIDVYNSDVDNIPDIPTLGYPEQWNWFDLSNSKISQLPPSLRTVYSDNLYIGGDSFHYLSDDLTVEGNLYIVVGQNLKKIAKKLKVTGLLEIEADVRNNAKFHEIKFGLEELPTNLEANAIRLIN